MFIFTQLLGLLIINAGPFNFSQEINGTKETISNPYTSWITPPEAETQTQSFSLLGSFLFAFIVAVVLLLLFSKLKLQFILRLWFFLVMVLALFLTLVALQKISNVSYSIQTLSLIAIVLALPLALLGFFGRDFITKNLIIMLVYVGIATVFIPILNVWTVLILIGVISVYDLWAVWKSGIMQKMAKYQINDLGLFPGFILPYASKKVKAEITKLKKLSRKQREKKLKNKKIKINIAVLGGGDIVFPLITAGVVMNYLGIIPALFVIAGSTLGLIYLFFFAKKRKAYPAMPFLTTGILIGLGLWGILF
jgi:presenilin-like A22 family membrane protease